MQHAILIRLAATDDLERGDRARPTTAVLGDVTRACIEEAAPLIAAALYSVGFSTSPIEVLIDNAPAGDPIGGEA